MPANKVAMHNNTVAATATRYVRTKPTVLPRGNVALARNILLVTRTSTTRMHYLPSQVYKLFTQKWVYAKQRVYTFKSRLFSLKATYYNVLLHCKHLPTPRFVFLERHTNIMPSFVSITLTITLSIVTSRANVGNLQELK